MKHLKMIPGPLFMAFLIWTHPLNLKASEHQLRPEYSGGVRLLSESELPESIAKQLDQILVRREAPEPESYMISWGLSGFVEPKTDYLIGPWGPVKNFLPYSGLGDTFSGAARTGQKPDHLTIEGYWKYASKKKFSDSNILGGNGDLFVQSKNIWIPEAKTTAENLSWYGAKLISHGDVIRFETDVALPVAQMSIGKHYSENYLQDKALGGGFYLEYHDRPHFHMPVDQNAGGYLILGKILKKREGQQGFRATIALSAFKIPYGRAIYTGLNVLHDDGLLTGNYAVVYSVTENFSTVILKEQGSQRLATVRVIKMEEAPGLKE